VRRRPYAVILFDEIEKAHPDVFNVLLQILDEGRLTDNQGRTVDFRNTVIIMTSNIGSAHILNWTEGRKDGTTDGTADAVGAGFTRPSDAAGWDLVADSVRGDLRLHFRPEFLNRVDDIVVFRPLSREDITRIVDLQVAHLRRLLAEKKINLEITPEAEALFGELGYDPVYGARPLKRVIQSRLQNHIAMELLEGRFQEGDTIKVGTSGGGLSFTKA
jgi:ATP-dependent Clp protease ATP-binding subunit ClpB